MGTGTVKWFSRSKGIGLITPDSGGKDLLAHFSAFQGEGRMILRENQKVSFDTTIGPKGDQASNIKSIDSSDSRSEQPGQPGSSFACANGGSEERGGRT